MPVGDRLAEESKEALYDPALQIYPAVGDMTNDIGKCPGEGPGYNRDSFQNPASRRDATPEFIFTPPTDMSNPILSPQNIQLLSNDNSAASLPFLNNEPKPRKLSQASHNSHGSKLSKGSRLSKVSHKSKLSRQSKTPGSPLEGFYNSKETEQAGKASDSEGELEEQIGSL